MIRLVRPINCFYASVAVILGAIIAGAVPIWGADLASLVLGFFVVVLISGGGYAVNDYVDRDIDAVNNPSRPIPSGALSTFEALVISLALFLLGLFLAVRINPPCFLLAGFNAAVLILYSFNLKRRGIYGNLTIGYLVGSTFLFGGLIVGDPGPIMVLAAMAALSTGGRELIKDIEDIRGDRELGSSSFPIVHGEFKAAVLALILTSISIALSPIPYWFGFFGKSYLVIVIVSVLVFIVGMITIARSQQREDAKRASLLYKVGMGLGLVAFLTGALVKA